MLNYVFVCLLLLSIVSYREGHRIEGKQNVHLVPHTHDDVGWLKTVDQYFYGANNSIQNAGVQYILDTVIGELVENPSRKFVYVEQAFFQRWWNEQNIDKQMVVKKLVANGQLEFINGGWCMHDEASTHYVAMIDQTTLGHRRLLRQFGAVPKIGWQIDPFGHSSTQAALLSARVGFTGLFFARIDYQDSQLRNANKQFEMIWRPSPSLGLKGQVFTGAFERNGYGSPYGFNWDAGSGDAPIQDDPRLEDYNVQQRVNDFVSRVTEQFSVNQGDDIMLTLGSDFEYSNAFTWFKNLDKLIHYVNLDGRVNTFYSTPSKYVDAKLASNITWSVKTDDFFPYADCPHCYWTGYFTSRPALKRYVRIYSAYLNMARQLEVLIGGNGSRTTPLEEAVGVAQHHDAVSGTSKQHVAYDYAKRISKGADVAADLVNEALANIISLSGSTTPLVQCTLLNETICDFTTNSNSFAVVVYNPLAKVRTELVRIPVGMGAYTVFDNEGMVIPSQTVASFEPFPKGKPAPYVVYFLAKTLGLGYSTYFVQINSLKKPDMPKKIMIDKLFEPSVLIENKLVSVEFSSVTGRLVSITNKNSNLTTKVSQDFLYYASSHGNNQNSGAYIFRPNSTTAYPACSETPQLTLVSGSVVQEIRYVACGWLAQTVRLTGDDPFVEFEYRVGAVPIDDNVPKEVISRFSTDVTSASLYYTDSNGREFQTRRRNFRPTWPLEVNEPVAGNYYPVNTAAYIKDVTRQFSILTDRSQGGGSIQDGQFELMVHRRLLFDDSRGVGEPLNETDGITSYPNPHRLGTGMHITGSHYVLLDAPAEALRGVRFLQSRVFLPLTLTFAQLSGTGLPAIKQWIATHHVEGTALNSPLPSNIDLLTLQSTGDSGYLLRLAHQFAVGEDASLSLPVTVDLDNVFSGLKLKNLKEVSLTANQDAKDIKPINWPVGGENAKMNVETFPDIPFSGATVTVNPMDIRTFTFNITL